MQRQDNKKRKELDTQDTQTKDKKRRRVELKSTPLPDEVLGVPLLVLPDEVLDMIGNSLNHKEIASVIGTCRRFAFFQEKVSGAKLIELVNNADYAAVENIINQNPELMFKHVNYLFPDGHTELTSPLKVALKNLDTYMWKMFQEKANSDANSMKRFKEQEQEHEQTRVNASKFVQ